MREWRCRNCGRKLVEYTVIDGHTAVDVKCPKCGERNVAVLTVPDLTTSLSGGIVHLVNQNT